MVDLSKLRICFLAGTLGQGGAERQLFYMLRVLRDAGAQLCLLCLTRGEYWENRIADLGIEVRCVGDHSSRISRCREIVRQVRAIKPDIVHSQHFFTNLYAVAGARWSGACDIGSLRNDAIHEVGAHRFPLGHASLRLPRTLVVNSRRGMSNAIQIGAKPSRIHLLPNVISCEDFERPTKQAKTVVSICFVGRLAHQKRVDVLLQAFKKAERLTSLPLELTVVGEGAERSQLECLATKLELVGKSVTFVGASLDPRAIYSNADILALTSDFEGTPNVVLEAMAIGLPVIATAVGGVPDLVRPGETGLLADAGDVDAVAGCIATLANDVVVRRRMGENAANFVRQNYSLAALAGHLERVYAAALS